MSKRVTLQLIAILAVSSLPAAQAAANNADVRIEELSLDKTALASNENATVTVRLKNYANVSGRAGWGVTYSSSGFDYTCFAVDGWEWIDHVRFEPEETKTATLRITNTGKLYEDKTVVLTLVVISGTEVKQDFNITFEQGLSLPKPSVPEFTLRFVDNSHYVPPAYGMDAYTGKEVMTQAGYHVQEKLIEVTIKNQPFTPYTDALGNSIKLYYSIRMKGHFSDSWAYPNYGYYYVEGNDKANFIDADMSSEYTVTTYGLFGNNGTHNYLCFDISAGGQADFQVLAFIGYTTRTTVMTPLGEARLDSFTGENSDWSSTQTITIPASALSSSILLMALIGVAVVVVSGLLVYFKKRSGGQHQWKKLR